MLDSPKRGIPYLAVESELFRVERGRVRLLHHERVSRRHVRPRRDEPARLGRVPHLQVIQIVLSEARPFFDCQVQGYWRSRGVGPRLSLGKMPQMSEYANKGGKFEFPGNLLTSSFAEKGDSFAWRPPLSSGSAAAAVLPCHCRRLLLLPCAGSFTHDQGRETCVMIKGLNCLS